MQMEDLIDARKDRREAAKDRAATATNKLLFGANAKVSDFYAKMQPIIATMDPAQRKTTHDSMRASVRGMLTAGGMKPEDADSYAESLIKPYGMQLQDETVEVNMGPNMTEQGLMSSGIVPQSSMNAQLGGAAPAPGQATDWQMQQDGTYGRVGSQRLGPSVRIWLLQQQVDVTHQLALQVDMTFNNIKTQHTVLLNNVKVSLRQCQLRLHTALTKKINQLLTKIMHQHEWLLLKQTN
jgi:hypothetical protein